MTSVKMRLFSALFERLRRGAWPCRQADAAVPGQRVARRAVPVGRQQRARAMATVPVPDPGCGTRRAAQGGGAGARGAAGKGYVREKRVRDSLASMYRGARVEVPCSTGVVDIVTDTEIIEVKRDRMWKAALGQVLAYSMDFPGKSPRVHLFGPDSSHFGVAAVTCERMGVRLTVGDDAGGVRGDRLSPLLNRRRREDNGAEVAVGVLGDELRGRPADRHELAGEAPPVPGAVGGAPDGKGDGSGRVAQGDRP